MKRLQWVCAFVFALLVGATAWAHGGMQHVMGTVKAVGNQSITVTTTQGKEVTVAIDDKTVFTKGDQPAAAKDVQAGEKVVVHAKKSGSGLIAETVKTGGLPHRHVGPLKREPAAK